MITVALVHYNSAELALACIESVRLNPPSEDFEVVVVDNGSRPDELRALRSIASVRLVETGTNGGFAVGVNRCFSEASRESDVVVVLNPDTVIKTRSAFDELAAGARAPGVALAAPLLLGRTGEVERTFYRRFPSNRQVLALTSAPVALLIDRYARFATRHPYELSRDELFLGGSAAHAMGAVMAISRRAWETVGPFDERYFLYLEETDWQLRAARAGLKLKPMPSVEVMHHHGGGDLAAGVPSPYYVESLVRFLVSEGSDERSIRLGAATGLASSVLAFSGLRVLALVWRRHRKFAKASLRAARFALRCTVPVPRGFSKLGGRR